MGKMFIKWMMVCLVLGAAVGCNSKKIGTRDNPIKLYLPPSVDTSIIRHNAKILVDYLQTSTGYNFEIHIPNNNAQMIDGFSTGSADVALINSYGYIIAESKFGVVAKLKALREGSKYYQGEIIVRTDAGINYLSDLNQKVFAFTDESSTSGYIFPAKLLEDQKVVLAKKIFVHQHDMVVRMVYERKVDAGAAFYTPASPSGEIRDARMRLIKEYPDIANKVKVLSVTESIPNDPLVFRKEMDEAMMDKIANAFVEFSKMEIGENVLRNIYGINGFIHVKDEDYAGLRKVINQIRKKNGQAEFGRFSPMK